MSDTTHGEMEYDVKVQGYQTQAGYSILARSVGEAIDAGYVYAKHRGILHPQVTARLADKGGDGTGQQPGNPNPYTPLPPQPLEELWDLSTWTPWNGPTDCSGGMR